MPRRSPGSLALIICIVFIVIAAGSIEARKPSARSQIQDTALTPKKEERELEDQIPKHLPIRIKIKQEKEEAFKDLKNDKWLRDFELEVKNVGDKPIYFLSLIFTMPEVKTPDGNDYGFSLHYGRGDLLDFSNSLKPEDTPLKVGDTYVFRIGKNLVEGWEHFRTQNKAMLRPKKALIRFNLVNFGDGTGFMGTTGVPIPNRPQTQGNVLPCLPDARETDPKWRLIASNYPSGSPFTSRMSATELPAFFLSDRTEPVATELGAMPDICCGGTSCAFLRPDPGRCYCSDPDFPTLNDKSYYVTASCGSTSAHAAQLFW
jgi:hypothetical protein